MPARGIDELAHDIALAIFPWTVPHAVLGRLAGPEAIAVVVFGGQEACSIDFRRGARRR